MTETPQPPKTSDASKRLYVYAIVAADAQPPQVAGFGGPLFVVRSGALGAVVAYATEAPLAASSESSESADPAERSAGSAATPSPRSLLRHEDIVEAICDEIPALPVRFGTIMPDGAAVARALESHAEMLLADLHRLGGRVEMGVIALWNPAGQAETPAGEEPSQPSQRDEPGEPRPGVVYLRQRQAHYQREEATRARAQRLGSDLDAELGPHALLSRRSLCPTEQMALRDAYLLERDGIQAFERAFEEARRRHGEARLLLSGPWPPYSFVTRPAARPAEEAGLATESATESATRPAAGHKPNAESGRSEPRERREEEHQ